MNPMRCTALIRTRDSVRTLPKTLAALQAQTLPPCAYVIVDSGSTDDTLAHVPHNATVHRYEGRTFNYAEALNQGLDRVATDYVLVISSHTRLNHAGALDFALRLLEDSPHIGAAYFCYENPAALEYRLIDRHNFTGFNGLWNTCAVIKTALLKQRRFRPEVFAAEDQEWAGWLFRSEGKAVARISGAGLQNDNPKKYARGKLLDEYAAVALFTNRSLLGWPHLIELAAKALRPTHGLALRERFLHLALFARLLACRFAKTGRRSILFLNHSASRNGASILLLHLLQWLHANADFRLEVLSDGGGPLIDEFRAVAPTRVWRNPASFLHAFTHPWAVALRSRLEAWLLRASLWRRRYDLVYANTAATWQHVAALDGRKGAVLWHIHELSYALRLTLGAEHARDQLAKAARLIAVSGPVAASLTDQFAVRQDRVDLVHGFVPIRDRAAGERQAVRRRILGEIGWPEDTFVVGACGGLGWRKGSDLFLQIARRLQQSDARREFRFLWVGGGNGSDTEALRFAHDAQALGLDAACRRIASTANVDDYYCAMDVFALPSREDPFPLVMLEAAVHGLPTVCFAASGGGPEFVAEDAGLVVPYLDLDAFAHAIEALRTEPLRRQALGSAAQRKVRLHHSVETQGPKLLRSIERCLASA